MKTCTQCQIAKPPDEFYANPRVVDGRFGECRDCNKTRARTWARSKRASDPLYSTNARLRTLYGIDVEQYEALLAGQGGGCAICGTSDSGISGRRFHVDHDHACCPGIRSCGRCLRALLCQGCNTGLGAFGEDVDRLMAAASYLLSRKDVLFEATAF